MYALIVAHWAVCLYLHRRTLCCCDSWKHLQSEDTALIRAAVHGRTDCVRILIDVGADKESKNNVRIPCIYAYLHCECVHTCAYIHSE